jgi:hypothetical protein
MSNRTKDKTLAAEKRGREKIRKLIGEGNWEQVEQELSKIKDPSLGKEFRTKVRRAAGWQKIERLLAEGADDDKLQEEFSALPPADPEESEWIQKMMKEESDRQACLQALRSAGKVAPKVNPSFATIATYYQLEPFDGIGSVLSQAITAMRNMTMDCLERASNSQALPVRALELNYATRGAIILPALTKALDSHRLRTEQLKNERSRRNQGNRSSKRSRDERS